MVFLLFRRLGLEIEQPKINVTQRLTTEARQMFKNDFQIVISIFRYMLIDEKLHVFHVINISIKNTLNLYKYYEN